MSSPTSWCGSRSATGTPATPSVWSKLIRRSSRINRNRHRRVDGAIAPGAHAEYLLYQTLLGTWPPTPLAGPAQAAYCNRICGYMIKASREAKRRTSWSNPNDEYEAALRDFMVSVLERRESNLFPSEVDAFIQRIARFGYLNSLSQLLCKLPRLSAAATSSPLPDLLTSMADGSAKLYVTYTVLHFRRAHADIFREGAYHSLQVNGEKAAHLCAYARIHPSGTVFTLVPRLFARLLGEKSGMPLGEDVWGDTTVELPEDLRRAAFISVLGTADQLSEYPNGALWVGTMLRDFPVGLIATPGKISSVAG
jgi:(1->4)-alpha-D-glucan 1-alpha-D-glucosylmutase